MADTSVSHRDDLCWNIANNYVGCSLESCSICRLCNYYGRREYEKEHGRVNCTLADLLCTCTRSFTICWCRRTISHFCCLFQDQRHCQTGQVVSFFSVSSCHCLQTGRCHMSQAKSSCAFGAPSALGFAGLPLPIGDAWSNPGNLSIDK